MPFMIALYRTEDVQTLLSYETARYCPSCEQFTHPWDDIGDIRRKPRRDCTLSFDGMHIISTRFKEVVEQVTTSEINFIPLSKGFFVFRPLTEIFLDVTDAYIPPAVPGTGGRCETCGRERAFFGYADDGVILPGQKDICPTDVLIVAQAIGSGRTSHQSIIIGDDVKMALENEKLIGKRYLVEFQQPSPLKEA